MSEDGEIEIPEGPEFEVWNHLWSGIDLASGELDVLTPDVRAAAEELGKRLADAHTTLTHVVGTEAAKLLNISDVLSVHPWVRHAADIELATIGIRRAERALRRYMILRPVVLRSKIPEAASAYIREVTDTFAFGFDPACIALCRATLEQILKDRLLAIGATTAGRLRREKPSAKELIAEAKYHGVIHSSVRSAEGILTRGNTVLHQYIYDTKVLEREALDSIQELLKVIEECVP